MKPITTIRVLASAFLGLLISGPLFAQGVKYDLFSLAQRNQFEVFNRKITSLSEKQVKGVRLSKAENDGVAWLKHIIFSNGTIEVDIRGSDVQQQSFVGIAFHGTDDKTMDVIYFRPFNFNAVDTARKSHSVQYVSLPEYPWEVLREKFKGKYEKSITPPPDANAWFHVKIVVKTPEINVFVNGNKEASLSIEKLNKRASGKIGLWVGNGSDGDFANLQVY